MHVISTPIEFRLDAVRQRVQQACQRNNRLVKDVQLLAVSKTQSSSSVEAAYMQGQRDFGENYLQEALPKMAALTHLPLRWHFIGHIQTNKTSAIAQHFDWVHSVSCLKIAQRLSQQRPSHLPLLQVCIQVNVDQGVRKSGVSSDEVYGLAQAIERLPHLQLRGLMAIPESYVSFEQQCEVFHRVAELLAHLQTCGMPQLDTLSMGMSADLEAAIACGSTWVRVGTAIFGARVSHSIHPHQL